MERQSGILLHITSLAGDQGCGTLGASAHAFADFLHSAGQRVWQILPTCPVDSGGSPYNSRAARAGCHLLIDVEPLICEGWLRREECEPLKALGQTRVDHARLLPLKEEILYTAYTRAKDALWDTLHDFYRREQLWLPDYALFMALHEHFGTPWQEWEEGIKRHEAEAVSAWRAKLSERVGFHVFVQYIFFRQWDALRAYANSLGIRILGDLPIYVAEDSADVWANREFFDLDEDCRPNKVSGVPPDAFSPDGQKWSNPLYRWDVLQQHHYSWWIDRLRHGLRLYDMLRLDHFRGFEAYWAVEGDAPTAKQGEWIPGPGMDLFRAACWQIGSLPAIAEDLGIITHGVDALRRESGFPGMRVLQFAFDGNPNNPYLPHNYDAHTVAYTGTHDNNTTAGWAEETQEETVRFARRYLGAEQGDISRAFVRGVWSSPAGIAIAPMQDILSLGADCRMNTPSTTAGNWSWRLQEGDLTASHAKYLLEITKMYGRA